eukprot:TRINITY_DN5308_c0_g1_i2.p1 TRINITY_DN5308_c0_g1~~TRINITY_DN5308_c0_g1_i2.p1  ORF type:complete len:270 (+),score=56.72 TRINITY_DN5308_c0_g1_i2:668-1477(+)
MGQRTWTFMIYLNDVEEGGETEFTEIGEVFTPQKGRAVIWNSLLPDGTPNYHSMHKGSPVIKGEKAIITKWFRMNSNLSPDVAPLRNCKEENEYIPNYTKKGFSKEKLPSEIFDMIKNFYQEEANEQEESVPGFITSQDGSQSSSIKELPLEMRNNLHIQMKSLMESWAGIPLEPTYVYGIRTYYRNAELRNHRDRKETHIISAILNIDQQGMDEDWPLVIEDNYYRVYNITMQPGEVVFYEGGRLQHGRPYPLKGDKYANVFVHYKPQ